jgi:hypothetical protein
MAGRTLDDRCGGVTQTVMIQIGASNGVHESACLIDCLDDGFTILEDQSFDADTIHAYRTDRYGDVSDSLWG